MTDSTDTQPGGDVAVYEPPAGTLALRGDQISWSPVQEAALAHIGIDKAPPADQQVFMHVCQRVRLDPFARQIYMIPRKERGKGNEPDTTKWTIQTGIDGFRLIAERHPQYRGQVGPQWCGPDGTWKDVWLDPQKPPVAARVGILRGDRADPIWGVALFREYAQTTTWNQQTQLTKMWREKGAHMVAKCAEALGFRRAFPAELSGLLSEDEAGRGDTGSGRTAVHRPAGVTVAELTGANSMVIDVDDEPYDQDPGVGPAEQSAPAADGDGRTETAAAAPPEAPPSPDQPAEPPASDAQHRMMHRLWNEADLAGKRDDRILVTQLLLERNDITSSKHLTIPLASALVDALSKLKAKRDGDLASAVNDLLNEHEAAEEEKRRAAAEVGEQTALGSET